MSVTNATPPTLIAAPITVALDHIPLVSCDRNACSLRELSVSPPPLTQLPADVQTIGPGAAWVWFSAASPGNSMAFVQYGSAFAVVTVKRLTLRIALTTLITTMRRPIQWVEVRFTDRDTDSTRDSIMANSP